MFESLLSIAFLAASVLTPPLPPRLPAPDGAEVYIIEPADGATVAKDFTVKFGLRGMGVAPAGINVEKTGHHHLLVDVAADKMPPFEYPLAKTDNVLHFGGGQTETTLTLPPGKHTLQLLLADHLHVVHEPPILSKKITVTVK
ncbi:MAG TPA: DUF4399 domain-containing protein [Xanthomonadales bacterium]|nr:DUF4399 domain-containing protein [Xanthomonadales bacterium]